MAMPQGRIPTKSWQSSQDTVENRTRVADYVDGTSKSYENTDFGTSNSPLVIDFNGDTGGKIGHKGWLIIDGPGDIEVEFSADGVNYGGIHTIKASERISLDGMSIMKMRLTWITDTGYRIAIF